MPYVYFMGRGTSTGSSYSVERRTSDLMGVDGDCDAMSYLEAASSSLGAARQIFSPDHAALTNVVSKTLDTASMLDLAAKTHSVSALVAASQYSAETLTMIERLPDRHPGLNRLLGDVSTQVAAVAAILQDLPTNDLPNVTSVERALTPHIQELDRLTGVSLGLNEWQESRSWGGDDRESLRHLVEASAHTTHAATRACRFLIRDAAYFVLPNGA